jgi:hypothetical protein
MAAVDWGYDLPAWASADHALHLAGRSTRRRQQAYHVAGWSRAAIPRCTPRNDLGICPNRTAINTVRDVVEAASLGRQPRSRSLVSAQCAAKGVSCTTSQTTLGQARRRRDWRAGVG